MRWAEFKTAVLISLAGRLTKWADSIERRIDYREMPPAPVLEDSEEVELTKSFHNGESPPGVPEHWARLVAPRPPRAWLNLIKERAPDLLSKTGNELLSDEATQEVFEKEILTTENEPSADSTVKRSRQETFKTETTRDELRAPSATTRRATWLNRLRFRPPVTSLSTSRTAYVIDSETGRSGSVDAPVHEGSAAGQERKASSAQLRLSGHQAVKRTFNHAVNKNRSEPRHTYPTNNSARLRNASVKDLQAKAAQRESPLLRLPGSNLRGRSSASSLQQTDVTERPRNVTPVSSLILRHSKRTRAADDFSSWPPEMVTGATKDTANVRTTGGARSEFASLDLAVAESNEPLSGSGENIWPSLPVAHDDSELADELAAMQREAERVRRLELEQRGTLWNA